MATLLQSGLTIQAALELCKSIAANSKTAALSQAILSGLNRGMPLNQVLKMYASAFSPLYRSLIRLGEQTGSVAGVFARMGSYLQSEKRIRGKLANVIWYPVLVLCLAVVGCFGIIFYVMPRMAEIFSTFNVGTNANAALELGNIYRSLWVSLGIFIFLLAAAIFILVARKISESFALLTDSLLLSLPLLGPFIQSLQTLDFSFAMEMLTSSGITVSNALKESASVITNRAFSGAVLDVHYKLQRGEKLSTAFFGYKAFPEYIGTWVTVGEKTGAVELVFSQIRSFFQSDVEQGSERLMRMIEPVLTIVTGLIVLVLIIQFVLPIFSLYGRIM
jgi:type II secretory pathway component PulF